MFGLFFRLSLIVSAAAILSLLGARFLLDKGEDQHALELLSGHAQMLAETIGDTPPALRRDKARELSEVLGTPLVLAPASGSALPRSEWRGGRVFVVVRVPGTEGQIVLGPLAGAGQSNLPSALLLAIAIALLIALYVSRPLSRRMREIAIIAERMRAGDFRARVVRDEGNVFDGVAGSLNALGDRIGQLVLDERDLLRTVAHEVRAPIARMRFRVEKLERRAGEENKKDSDGLVSDLVQVDNLFEELLTYVAFDEFDQDRPKLKTEEIALVERSCKVIREVTGTHPEILVDVEGPDSAKIVASSKLFDRALTNLLLNAMVYGGPRLRVEIREFKEECVVDVQDSGPGIAEEERLQVVKPFVRLARKKTRGTGLGLAIVSRIMRLHGGKLHILDGPQGGASIQLSWKKSPPTLHLITPERPGKRSAQLRG